MPTPAETSLSALERSTLERFVELLGRALGDDLVSVWLYGSRARGERPSPESDVDVLVLTRGDPKRDRTRASTAMESAAEATGASRFLFSLQVVDLDWLADQRAVEAFFLREVERDRIVLAGDAEGDERPPLRSYTGVRPRTLEMLDTADRWLEAAKRALEADPAPSISLAYYAMLYAARAALSERDQFARRHQGTWHLFRENLVESGNFDPVLAQAAAATQQPREGADYRMERFSEGQARATLELAERFVAAVKETIEA